LEAFFGAQLAREANRKRPLYGGGAHNKQFQGLLSKATLTIHVYEHIKQGHSWAS
jgi:hypothetical protein